MSKQCICLRAIDPQFEGKVWQSNHILRIGRAPDSDVVLNDSSISRRHAEVALTGHGWVVRDLGSTNGTFVNGIRVGLSERKLCERDVLQCGNVVMIVVLLQEAFVQDIETPVGTLQVQATAQHTWEESLELLAMDVTRHSRPGEQLQTLLRAGHYLYQISSFDELLRLSLQDAVSALKAQRGSILLFDESTDKLTPRALYSTIPESMMQQYFSMTLAQRCHRRGESLLCVDIRDDTELVAARSVMGSSMSSIICALLRTPTKRLGVLHLDRGPMEDPFTTEDLHLADAIAASLSAGFASAQLLQEKQRNVFVQTVIALAQALVLRDPYTGGHAQRVTDYSLILADQLKLASGDRHVLQVGAPLHDIGKIGDEDKVLRKQGRLTPEEYELMKAHTVKGAALLETIPDLAMTVPMIRHHHERWDGAGYPDGLAGEQIPPLARVVAVAETFDALTFDGPYPRVTSTEEAFSIIHEGAGTQFDPKYVEAFLQSRPRVEQTYQQHRSLLQATGNAAGNLAAAGGK